MWSVAPLLLMLLIGLSITLSAPVKGASQATVTIGDSFFDPQEVTIIVGATVLWRNNGTLAHTSTSDTALWNSGNIQPGGSYRSPIFTTAGVFNYHSSLDSSQMSGKVIVVPASAATVHPETVDRGLLAGYAVAIFFAVIVVFWLNYPSSQGKMKTRAR